jgi:hypothetical protein
MDLDFAGGRTSKALDLLLLRDEIYPLMSQRIIPAFASNSRLVDPFVKN